MSDTTSLKLVGNDIIEHQKETFIAALSHDLKNPTIAQIRILELFLKGKFGVVNNNQREIIEMLLSSCKYMNAMLGSFLTTYRADNGTIKLLNEKLSIHEISEECLDEIEYLAQDKNISTKILNFSNCNIIWGDSVQIRRVIMNLLTNGIKYAYKNSELIVRIFNDDYFVYFEFENHSPFLSEEKRKKIFAKYISYTQAHESYGIGLGLFTSKKIIEAHDGKMYVKSFENNTNIFGFKIPFGTEKPEKTKTISF